MNPKPQTGPAAVGGPAAGEVNAPRVIEMDAGVCTKGGV